LLLHPVYNTLTSEMKQSRQLVLVSSILLFSFFVSGFAAAQKKPSSKKARSARSAETANFAAVDSLVQEQINADAITGAVLVVGHNGHILHQKAFGARAISPRREPMTTDTIFDLASLTKVVATTPSVMRLLQYGQIRLDDPVARYIPDFGMNGKESVSVRQLLTHYSGLRPDLEMSTAWQGQEAAFRLAHEEKLQAPPGAQFVYSDINFIELGELVQRLSGLTLDQYARVHIFEVTNEAHPLSPAPELGAEDRGDPLGG
jgi:CubicO group peptidase (beta-lactamase class C family)